MATFKEAVRTYKFSDARLIEVGLEKIAFAERDATELATVGIASTWVDDLQDKLDAFTALPSDEVELGEQEEATAEKDTDAGLLLDKLKELRSAAKRAFGEKHADYRQFSLHDLDDKTDAELLKTGVIARGVALTHATPLLAKGWDTTDNDDLQTRIDDFGDSLKNKSIEIGSRDSATENRIIKGNEFYDLLANELCEAGKEYWRTRSEAKFNDYIIYDTPSQAAAAAGYQIEEVIVPANSSFQIELDVPVIPNLELYLEATDGSLLVCTTNLPAVPCAAGNGYLLQQGVVFKNTLSALNLDLTKTHLQFTNTNPNNVVLKVGRKNP